MRIRPSLSMGKCLICGEETRVIFGIGFDKKHICGSCANTITKQNVVALCNADSPKP